MTLTLPSTCLPTLRLLFVKLFPILSGSLARSGQQYYNYGSGNELGNIKSGERSRRNGTVQDSSVSRGSTVCGKGDGIIIQQSYSVKRNQSDADEASLVSHESPEERFTSGRSRV